MTNIFTRTEPRVRVVGGSASDDGVIVRFAAALILAFMAVVVLQLGLGTGIGIDPDAMAGPPFP